MRKHPGEAATSQRGTAPYHFQWSSALRAGDQGRTRPPPEDGRPVEAGPVVEGHPTEQRSLPLVSPPTHSPATSALPHPQIVRRQKPPSLRGPRARQCRPRPALRRSPAPPLLHHSPLRTLRTHHRTGLPHSVFVSPLERPQL